MRCSDFATDEHGETFEFFLAEKMGRTVAELRESMSNAEYVKWCAYHALRVQAEEVAAKRK